MHSQSASCCWRCFGLRMATSTTQSYALLQTSLALMDLRVNGSETQKNIDGLAALESSRAARYFESILSMVLQCIQTTRNQLWYAGMPPMLHELRLRRANCCHCWVFCWLDLARVLICKYIIYMITWLHVYIWLFSHNYNVLYVGCECAVSLQEYQSLCNEYRCSPMQACALGQGDKVLLWSCATVARLT